MPITFLDKWSAEQFRIITMSTMSGRSANYWSMLNGKSKYSRIYIFGCGERKKIYIASADFMTRNTVRRVEVATPIYEPEIAQRLEEMFITMLSDNQKAREEDEEGNYHLIYRQEDTPLNSQEFFYESAYNNALQ